MSDHLVESYDKQLELINSNLVKKENTQIKANFRSDIIDINGNFLAKAVSTQIVGINPIAIIDKKKLLIKLKILFPEKDFNKVEKRIKKKKYFRFKKELTLKQIEELRLFGDSSIRFEEQITRLYPQKNLFSHIIGQIDEDNKGITDTFSIGYIAKNRIIDVICKDLEENYRLNNNFKEGLSFVIRNKEFSDWALDYK